MTLVPCPSCERHVLIGDACADCARAGRRSATAKKAATIAIGGAFAVALSACYGGPPRPMSEAGPAVSPTSSPSASGSGASTPAPKP